ncbi:MAG TPA: cytochrome c biogenesis protein CcdA [Spirochaetota bacterium]|nr:cytochrome c biogenesis protein CcdA [Spirochaetota bacterium]
MTRLLSVFAIIATLLALILQPLSPAWSFSGIRVQSAEKQTAITAGSSGYFIIELTIPRGSYIYGNPKGPGIGKPTTVRVVPVAGFAFQPARFLPPGRYTAAGEKDFVWIYEGATSILLPFYVDPEVKPSTHSIKIIVEALVCTHGACMPQMMDIDHSIKVLPSYPASVKFSAETLSRYTIFSSDAPDKTAVGTPPSGSIKDARFTPRYVSASDISSIVQAVLLGLIAGLILNFMPCVLPVVSLKLMGFVRHVGEQRGTLKRLGLLFSLGILTSFAVLAALGSFLGYNWGELFQKRLFLVGMIAVIFAMGLSLLGVFTLGVPSFASRVSRGIGNAYVDSYVKGMLATLLATPCSGPFLGGTLAFAFTQPPTVIFAIFMSIGVGMAFPYLALAAAPGLIRFVPRPGDWMVIFEQAMGLLLLGTTVYLMGILHADSFIPVLWFLLVLAIGLWQYGRFGNITRSARSRAVSAAVLVLFTAAGYWLSFEAFDGANKRAAVASTAGFSMEALESNREAGRISIVKFTADWCPNCVLVEKTSLYTPDVVARINEQSITLFTADLTRENPAAQDLLRALGSRSIPLLAVFPPGKRFNEPVCLRDIYSEKDVLEAILLASSP